MGTIPVIEKPINKDTDGLYQFNRDMENFNTSSEVSN